MNNRFTLKGVIVVFLLLVFYFGMKHQASANTRRMICDTDTTNKGRIIKSDTTLLLKAGTKIVRNADTILIINGVPTKVPVNSLGVKNDGTIITPNTADTSKGGQQDTTRGGRNTSGVSDLRNGEPLPNTTVIAAPPSVGTIQVKSSEGSTGNNTIVAPPTDGLIQVKNTDGSTTDGSGFGNNANGTAGKADSTGAAKNGGVDASGKAADGTNGTGKTTDAAGNTIDAGTNGSITNKNAADSTANSKITTSAPPVNGEIQVRKVDTLAKKDSSLKKDSTAMKADSTAQDTTDVSQIKAKNVYLGVGGAGLAISVSYDSRFGKQRDGWGYTVGVGGFVSGGNRVVTVPFQVNFLIGEHSSMFEVGGGTTFLNSTGDNKGKTWEFDKITGFIATGSIGYRYQPEHKGLSFRVAFVPILYDEGIIPAGGISVGYTFK